MKRKKKLQTRLEKFFAISNIIMELVETESNISNLFTTLFSIREHEGLDCKTPLEARGIKVDGNNKWLISPECEPATEK